MNFRHLLTCLTLCLMVSCSVSASPNAPTATILPTHTPPLTLTSTPDATPSPLPPTPTLSGPAAEIDAHLEALTARDSFTGAVLVAQGGKLLLSRGYGLADRMQSLPNTASTRFRIYSVTKQFTAMGIMILQSRGALNVQDRICAYVQECPAAWESITIHHLLTHTSGIKDFTAMRDYEQTKATPSSPLQTIARFKDFRLQFDPGDEWRYSNSGYIVLGYIIEQASGMAYDEFIQDAVFDPLQMKDSGYDHNLDSIARGYAGRGGKWLEGDFVDMSIPYAAGALYSTVEDLYRWDQSLYTEQLIPQGLLDMMFRVYVNSPIGGFGYGWIIAEEHNRRVYRHGGGGDGFTSLIERYPDDGAVIIILSNRNTTDVGEIAEWIGTAIFGE